MTKWMLLCAATIGISGCAVTAETRSDSPSIACNSFVIIEPSRADTLDTKRQILAHNKIWRKLCA